MIYFDTNKDVLLSKLSKNELGNFLSLFFKNIYLKKEFQEFQNDKIWIQFYYSKPPNFFGIYVDVVGFKDLENLQNPISFREKILFQWGFYVPYVVLSKKIKYIIKKMRY